ncbi:RICIN domain-containing protein [Streptomyces sp. HD1123-B1]|uniref:RICIN domain-containing protein n=1 Tax=Streptomyces huangiella TaxID=3228804 RepID=UPI003D7E17EC
MGRAGRPHAGLRGETEHINALARLLGEVTRDLTVRELAERYAGGGKTMWGLYRSGERLVPAHLLEKVINDRVRDEPTRLRLHAEAGRLYALTEARQPRQPAPTKAAQALADAVRAQRQAEADLAECERLIQTLLRIIADLDRADAPGRPADAAAHERLRQVRERLKEAEGTKSEALKAHKEALSTLRDARAAAPETSGAPGGPSVSASATPLTSADMADSADNTRPPPTRTDSLPGDLPPPRGGRPEAADRWNRWRTPAQWAALAALVGLIYLATHSQGSGRQRETATPPLATAVPGDIPSPRTPVAPPRSPSTAVPSTTAPTSASPPPSASSSKAPKRADSPGPARTTPSASRAVVPPAGRTMITNANSDQCLAVPAASTTSGTQVNQFPCGDYPDHYWNVQAVSAGGTGSGYYRILNSHSKQCLSIADASLDAAAAAVQRPCGSSSDQRWRLEKWPDGVRIVNGRSKQCLAVPAASKEIAMPVNQFPCDDYPDHYWMFDVRT